MRDKSNIKRKTAPDSIKFYESAIMIAEEEERTKQHSYVLTLHNFFFLLQYYKDKATMTLDIKKIRDREKVKQKAE